MFSVGGDYYGVAGFPTEGTVTEHASPVSVDLGDRDASGLVGPTGNVFEGPDLRVSPTISSSEVVADLLGSSSEAEIIDSPQLMIYPDVTETGVAYKIGWVASVDDGGRSREVVVDAFISVVKGKQTRWKREWLTISPKRFSALAAIMSSVLGAISEIVRDTPSTTTIRVRSMNGD